MIVGRAEELAALEALITDVRAQRGRGLLLRGQAGSGKTTLLEEAHRRAATGAGVLVLRACGVETESELPFAGLTDLLGPIASERSALARPQADALAGALALARPAPGERLAVCVATLGLLRAASGARPILVLVDDVQWLDPPSRECVLYAARRSSGAVAILVAVRDGPAGAARLVEGARLPELRVGPLDTRSARRLLAGAAPDLAPPVAQALVDAAAGNPLALLELPGTLSLSQRSGVAPLPHPLGPGAKIGAVYEERIRALPAVARDALLIVAAYEHDDLVTLGAAGATARRLSAAEAGGLVRFLDGRVAFVHPLMRGAAVGRTKIGRAHV